MFDFSFSELMVVGVVALIVLGPERLPKVARTAGHLFGRLQRYVSDVKQQVKQEMDVEDLKKFQTEFQGAKDAFNGVEQSIHNETKETEQQLLRAVDSEPPSSLDFVEEPIAHEVTPREPSPQLELPLAAADPTVIPSSDGAPK
ncbi:MAG: twin-arginine translocase subunit TatB [Burkholderiales bacterium]|nr:twin-arginine translocase subunit TatB [Burkholderiales bacterium]